MSRRKVFRAAVVPCLVAWLVATCPFAAERAEASGSGQRLVVRYDPDGAVGTLLALVQTAAWNVLGNDTTSGLLHIEKGGLLSWSLGTVFGLLENLGLVLDVELEIGARHHANYQGQQTIPIMLEDDLDLAAIRPSDAYTLMNTPLVAPTPSSTTPRIALLDGGFQFGHEMLPSSAVAGQWDAIDHDGNAADLGNGVDDDQDGVTDSGRGHGLGMAAAALVVCPHADLYCVRVLDDEGRGTNFSVAIGISWAIAQGVDVINLSFGMLDSSGIVGLMLQDAVNQGIVVVASAGNQGGGLLAFPASLPHVLAVAGVEPSGDAHTISNHHPDVWMSAPSAMVPGPHPSANDAYGWWTGTSVSSALAAGLLALAIGEDPSDPEGCVDDIATEVVTFGNVPFERIDRLGEGILNVGAFGSP